MHAACQHQVQAWLCCLQGLTSAVNYTCYVAGRDAQPVPNYATPATVLNVSSCPSIAARHVLLVLPAWKVIKKLGQAAGGRICMP